MKKSTGKRIMAFILASAFMLGGSSSVLGEELEVIADEAGEQEERLEDMELNLEGLAEESQGQPATELTVEGNTDSLYAMTVPIQDERITREQFMALLVEQFGYTVTETESTGVYPDVEGRWSAAYVAAGIRHQVLSEDEETFRPEEPVDRGTAVVWVMNALGLTVETDNPFSDLEDPELIAAACAAVEKGFISGYDDGTFRPDEQITAAEAQELVERAAAYRETAHAIREDASNTVELQEQVKYAVSNASVNVPTEIDPASRTLTLTHIDSAVEEMDTGDILYLNPCENFPEGFLGKVESIAVDGDTAVMVCAQPSLAEVIKSADISAEFSVSAANYMDDGEMAPVSGLDEITERIEQLESERQKNKESESETETTEARKQEETQPQTEAETAEEETQRETGEKETEKKESQSVKTDSDIEFYAYYDDYLAVTDDGVNWGLWGGVGESASVTFQTDSYAKKEGAYASLEMTLDAVADIQLVANGLDFDVFMVYMNVNTQVNAVAGYHIGGEATLKKELPTCVIPVSGPITMTVKPYLVMNAKGEFSVEATAELTNNIGFYCSSIYGENAVEKINETDITLDFKAEAEGSLEVGPEIVADLGLCGTAFFDGATVVTADAFMGFGVEGKTAVEQKLEIDNTSADYSGHQNTPDEDGNIHVCWLCIQGEAYMVDRLTIGLGEELNKQVKKLINKELTFHVPDIRFKLFDWHYSAGYGYGPEFALEKCPHIAYPVVLQARDKKTGEALSGAQIRIHGETLTTDAEGQATIWLENDTYSFAASKEDYQPKELTGALTVAGKRLEQVLEFEPEDIPVIFSSSIAEYEGVIYCCQRDVPGMVRISVQPAEYDYICGIAFYNDRLYYCCKQAGTSGYGSAIYSCNMDGSDQRWIASGQPESGASFTEFIIMDGSIYYGSAGQYCLDLETGQGRNTVQGYDDEALQYFQHESQQIDGKYYPAIVTRFYGEAKYYSDYQGIHQVKDGVDQLLCPGSQWRYLEAVTENYVYYSDYADNFDYLYRIDLQTGETVQIDGHQSAGSGGYFNW